MDKKYSTTHKGIAAYLLMQGYEIERCEPGTSRKTGRPNVRMEFSLDYDAGRDLGDAFFEGGIHGDLKLFFDKLNDVGQKIWEVRNGNR